MGAPIPFTLATAPPADLHGRPLSDLRISVLDRCNFRCPYCMPEEQYPRDHAFLRKAERLRFEEIARLARIAAGLGVRKLRLTGGEPLLRRDVPELVRQLAAIPGIEDIALTFGIGNSAARGELSLALLLIIGFGLHNATEGFGIVAPLAAGGERPSWGTLALLGLIGGGPTFLGTLVGQHLVDNTISIAFLGLAAGSILYVVIELLAVARRAGFKELTAWCVLGGLVLGFATDAIVTAAGA